MDECILFPSPNWFQASGMSVSRDGWLIYGGPTKSLCVLEPLPVNSTSIVEGERYRAHVLTKGHTEKIVTVDINPEWPEKKMFLTGSTDGTVKQWIIELINGRCKFKFTHNHDSHKNLKEELVGVGYSNEACVLSVGNFGNLVKWNLKSNLVKIYKSLIKGFKPTCLSCSPHIFLHVAVGTKQGVIFVIDLNGKGNILYKVRCQDDDVINVSWCPQYEVLLKKTLSQCNNRVSANERMAKIRQGSQTTVENLNQSYATKNLPDDSFDESIVVEDDTFDIYTDHDMDLFGPKKYEPEDIVVKVKKEKPVNDNYLAECLKLRDFISHTKQEEEAEMAVLIDGMEKTQIKLDQKQHLDDDSQVDWQEISNVDEKANIGKSLEKNQVENEQKEHGAGDSNDERCSSGKEKVIDEPVEKEHVESKQDEEKAQASEGDRNIHGESSFHVHRHLLATIGKQGGVQIWSKSGKRISYCNVVNNKNQKTSLPSFPTVLWYKVDCLLIGDGRTQLLECNPLKIDSRNRLQYRVVHSFHKKGLFCVVSDAPKVQIPVDENKDKPNNWCVWTAAQDRSMVKYSMGTKKRTVYESCGGFLYTIQSCPYDFKKIAITVGDGAVRIWEADTTYEDDSKLCLGYVRAYWHKVQGKVMTAAWHPTRENLLAFGTGEARVGLIDIANKNTKTLVPAQEGPVYSLCWGENDLLYAGGKGKLLVYNTLSTDEHPKVVEISLEGHKWDVACLRRFNDELFAVGSLNGAVAVVDEANLQVLAANYIYSKTIYNVECHPQQTSMSNDKSLYHNIIAVSAVDKVYTITLLEYVTNDDGKNELKTWKVLTGHKNTIIQMAWNPHKDELLVSTSQDTTVRVWDIEQEVCLSIFGGHAQTVISASWSPHPELFDCVLSGGHDCALRLWRYTDFPAETFSGKEKSLTTKREKRKLKEKKAEEMNEVIQAQELLIEKVKITKKYLFPLIGKQLTNNTMRTARKILQIYIDSNAQCINGKVDTPIFNREFASKIKTDVNMEDRKASLSNKHEDSSTEIQDISSEQDGDNQSVEDENAPIDEMEYGLDFIKMFGTTNNVNEILDMEMKRHLDANLPEPWIVMCILRGHIDTMIKFANSRDLLCPYLISITPCVSFKYWKDAMQMYLAQIDRFVAKGEEEKLCVYKQYGGTVYRKAGSLLSIHDVKGAVDAFVQAGLYREAYFLCRIRYMDSIAQEVLRKWAMMAFKAGTLLRSAICYLVLGELSEAISVLTKSENSEHLCLAADIAKFAGHKTLASQMEDKLSNMKLKEASEEVEESLEELPTRMELLLRNGTAVDEEVSETPLIVSDVKSEE